MVAKGVVSNVGWTFRRKDVRLDYVAYVIIEYWIDAPRQTVLGRLPKVREPDDLNYNDDDEAVLSFAFIYNIVTELRRSSTVRFHK